MTTSPNDALASVEDRAKMRAQQDENAKSACICTIKNPGKRAQVIYDGITNGKALHFKPGETREGVRLAEHMVVRLQEQENQTDDPENRNLRIVDWTPAPPEAAQARPVRKPRPTRAAAA